ncbi:Integral membrane protein (intg_mem_TP0381) [Mycoplasmopsis maculosa]|uniref:Integral membrane protein (Intg_mem_TP0381) n=1 Tax=Mycoplasmopsis maculosa TaxID=114885 RepID=A0A449B3R2_9BACT|nr:YwaF family protein [Mycoplasmopsis maculosa]VEU75244.1 Integral membrane protein (intg_mem_TP0381) [Mycoplasmopsis maculosa]
MNKFFQSPFFIQEMYKNVHGTLSFIQNSYSIGFYVLFFTLIYISSFLIFLFRIPIRNSYKRKQKILGLKKKNFWKLIGWITLFFICLRSITFLFIEIYGTNDYKIDPIDNIVKSKLWEFIPLHFCRIILLFIAFSLITYKLNLVKYFAYLGFLAGVVATIIPGLYNYSGFDSWWYWDYILAHGYVVFMIILLWIIVNPKYTLKDTLISLSISLLIGIFMFLINLITYNVAIYIYPNDFEQRFKIVSNYWYLGINEYNEFQNLLGVLTKWPYSLLGWTLIGIILFIICIILSSFLSKVKIIRDANSRKLKFIFTKSKYWFFYKKSFNLKNKGI